MGKDSGIEWTHHTFNPWWGCAKVSPACANCYAAAQAKRYGHEVWSDRDGEGPRRTFGQQHWRAPLKWNDEAETLGERHRVFCASMADVFEDHRAANVERYRLWDLIRHTPQLDWLLLTKRPQNIAGMLPEDWGDGYHNVWLGVTVENHRYLWRIEDLLKVPAAVYFVSGEPLLGQVQISPYLSPATIQLTEDPPRTRHVDWVIVGGESGGNARSMDLSEARSIRDDCQAAGVAFFFKQMGGRGAKKTWDPIPDDLQIREFPARQEATP